MTQKDIPTYFSFDTPEEDEERVADPLRLSDYYGKLASCMFPSLSTTTSKGVFYFFWAYWADYEGEHKECFFNKFRCELNAQTAKEKQVAYNRMEWALSSLNRNLKKPFTPIGIRELTKGWGKEIVLKGKSCTTQNALSRYKSRVKGLFEVTDAEKTFEKLAGAINGKQKISPVAHFFIDCANNDVEKVNKHTEKVRKVACITNHHLNKQILGLLCKVETKIADIKQGAFLNKIDTAYQLRKNNDTNFSPTNDKIMNCFKWIEAERELGRLAMKLYFDNEGGCVEKAHGKYRLKKEYDNAFYKNAKTLEGIKKKLEEKCSLTKGFHEVNKNRPRILYDISAIEIKLDHLDWFRSDGTVTEDHAEDVEKFMGKDNVHDLYWSSAKSMIESTRWKK